MAMKPARLKKIRGFRAIFATFLATAAGAGFGPLAPGTYGTLVGLPIAYGLRYSSWEIKFLFWGLLTVVGTWAATVFDEMMQTNDNSQIVIDEVIGMGIASWTLTNDPLWMWGVGFLLFRFFDVLKPFPIRFVDRWSKKQKIPYLKGFGVIADDILAGIASLICIIILQKIL